jgi:phosphoribosylaminoimidazolecarboxamide formyltransferase/IMP cyclohydrolase
MLKIKRALISVSNKSGLVDLAKKLQAMGIEMVSMGGTFNLLQNVGIRPLKVSEVSEFPEILDGRLKTLHPKIHGAILARPGKEAHLQDLKRHDITPIEMVVVNLYPFPEAIHKQGVTLEDAIEEIDIGGPTLIRAAAKNYENVVVLVNPNQYPAVLAELEKNELQVSLKTRQNLAIEAFQHTMEYDSYIIKYLKDQFKPDS